MSSRDDSALWIDYDYAVVRVVPKVHLGAYHNVGVVLHARRLAFLDARIEIDRERFERLGVDIDLELLNQFVDAYLQVCKGGVLAGPVGALPQSERFHWLTAPRSAVLQTSAVHPGRCHDPARELDLLFREQCS